MAVSGRLPVFLCVILSKVATDLEFNSCKCNFSSKGKPTLPTITKIKTCARETQIKYYL